MTMIKIIFSHFNALLIKWILSFIFIFTTILVYSQEVDSIFSKGFFIIDRTTPFVINNQTFFAFHILLEKENTDSIENKWFIRSPFDSKGFISIDTLNNIHISPWRCPPEKIERIDSTNIPISNYMDEPRELFLIDLGKELNFYKSHYQCSGLGILQNQFKITNTSFIKDETIYTYHCNYPVNYGFEFSDKIGFTKFFILEKPKLLGYENDMNPVWADENSKYFEFSLKSLGFESLDNIKQKSNY